MPEPQREPSHPFDVRQQELAELFKPQGSSEGLTKAVLFLAGFILTPVTLLGAVLGYKRAYSRFMQPLDQYPSLGHMRPIVRVAMILGSILIWVVLYLFITFIFTKVAWIFIPSGEDREMMVFSIALIIINLVVTLIMLSSFARWRSGISNYMSETRRHGSARFARQDELAPYTQQRGFYIGADYYYNKAGHLLTVAGTRGGKGVNLILPNLLKPRLFAGSWVVIDPKGENAAISARIQREAGRKVILLNPWDLLSLGQTSYNPLDLLIKDRLNLSDDVQMIAECIVPINADAKEDDHFNNRARTFISGLLLHLVTAVPEKEKHLGTLWHWLRLDTDKWVSLLADMALSEDEISGDIIRATANEIISLRDQSEREYGSIMSTAQKWTDFIKSPAMQDNLQASQDFSSSDLADGNTTVYVIIPADRLKTHGPWLRLVVSSLMRSVIRNPKKDVCFLLDEFYALGYLSEIDIALGSYAGYGVHVWAILQNLVQLEELYGRNWENFLSSCAVRHFFNVSDNTTAEYVSNLFGQTSVPTYDNHGQLSGASARALVTPDELRRTSGDVIYTILDQLAPAALTKKPYFDMGLAHDPNPYFKERTIYD